MSTVIGLDKNEVMALNEIHKRQGQNSFCHFPQCDELVLLCEKEMVQVDTDNRNEQGEIATALTNVGFNYINDYKGDEMSTDTLEKPEVTYEVVDFVPIPDKPLSGKGSRGPRKAKYPFDLLEVGQSFHVPQTEDCPDPRKVMASSVVSYNKKYEVAVEPPQFEMKTKKRRVKDADGNSLKDENGKYIMEEYQDQVQVTQPTRLFAAFTVDASDPGGVGARVFRLPLPESN